MRNLEKTWELIPFDTQKVQGLQKDLGIHPLFCQLLVQRGIEDYETAKRFFRPQLSHLHDPFLMKDMDIAVSRLQKAIAKKERVLLYGDYDVDGTTSVALLYSFLETQNVRIDYYIPDRYKEGYGISYQGIEFAKTNAFTLIIAMDCGITATKQVALANSYGIDMIICDHHLPGDTLPEAIAVLDPKRSDCAYPYKELSGCGVTFKFIQAYLQKVPSKEEDLWTLLDFLVISIACDIVPITGENRVLAFYGLQQLNRTKRPGLKALIRKSKREAPLTISDVVFGLGPMINASGRLADAAQAVRLLLSGADQVAEDYARVLDYRNKLRKEFDQRTFSEAKEVLLSDPDWEERQSIVLFNPHWHKGVVGIVASRMVERFHKPTLILTSSDDKVVGSARSVQGFDIHEALKYCEAFLINYGGHKYAAGLSLAAENLPFFKDRFEAVVQTSISAEQLKARIPVSGALDLKQITAGFWKLLEQFAPFGPGNRNPVFITKGVRDTGYSRILKEEHLRLSIRQHGSDNFNAIAFGKGAQYELVRNKKPFDICYTIEENKWQGRSSLQLMVKDIKSK